MEIAVVGDEDFVLGYKLVGIRKTYPAEDEELESVINDVLQDTGVGILVLSSRSLGKVSAGAKRRIMASSHPVVISVGAEEEEDLREKVKKAIGVDLYKS
ncbi:MAG: V-type ATP synthase subunit F [Thermoplasmata archaeon]|nr:V-type ATP synthase subunit F [Candidatus Thermoplasmatota archaeon]MCK4456395.1 V-type ATP synthase subunit F [Thermoplasmata archaeon]